MRSIGSRGAKAQWSGLLKDVARGETILITRRGRPIARLVPYEEEQDASLRALVEEMRRDRASRPKVTREEILATRDEGRKR